MRGFARRLAVFGVTAAAVAAPALPAPSAQAQTGIRRFQPAELGIRFDPDGDPGQCGGRTGDQWIAEGTWTDVIRFDTDGRPGGCGLAFGVHDPDRALDGVSLTYALQATGGGDPAQCGNQGTYGVPIRRDTRAFGPTVRIDTDNRPGGCDLTLAVPSIGQTYVALDVQYDPDGDRAQCRNTGYHWAETDRGPVTVGIDTDDRPGGCRLRLRLRIGL
ncbi:hypothetical protein [Kitasatospora sp. A2-31]|uniref:hypothetical protein n=1 Tax=Kitasatospora sp. A2-31 TaxID=2916414 RepID=UPI001EEE9BE3|nr:hypothetical protein [Kitasatospora sp. A2-31]MCG6499776.1 hypothetical protein [Kitasatospora sp. A2-31]